MSHRSENRERAAHLLAHYLELASQGKIDQIRGDCHAEVHEIVDLIVEAAKDELRHEGPTFVPHLGYR